ncbi:unnamed protein product [Adineta ricciae]|uniref:MACPF domain-containing protein n=1 Tax=Adineta ricciae TaxID=249248 RepID=A0A814K195_ADIRI|nr:unnamed protein product [Adineta ricciae]CAF1044831.1 unnamed protein product [Adineta ricciae]
MFLPIYIFIAISSAAVDDQWAFVRRRLELSSRTVNIEGNDAWLPNSGKIGCGYNLARGSPVCYTSDCQMNGFGRPVFALEYTKRSVGSCDERLIPDNVNLDCFPSTDSTSNTEVISTLHQLQVSTTKGIDTQTSVSGGFAGYSASFSYAHSEQTRSMIDTIVKEKSTVLFTTLKTSWVRLSLFEPKMNLSDDFHFVIEHVPCCELNKSSEEYIRRYIIDYFGYAYVHDMLLGGVAQQRIVITQSDRSNLEKNGWTVSNEASMSAAARQIFSTSVKVKTTETYDKEKLDTFSRYTRQDRVTTLGGDIILQSFEEWSKTVKTNPVIIKFGVSLIFDLLTNKHFPNDSDIVRKSQLIQKVIEKYLINPLYCYNQCTHPSHGTCIDSGYFQFGVCECHNGWTGLDCSTEVDGQIQAQTDTHGVCTVWGGFHLVGFPVSSQQMNLRSGYWCRATGRTLLVKNPFIEFYINVTASSYQIEYYEIIFFYNGLKLCTITPQNENCSSEFVEVKRLQDSPTSRQIFYYISDQMEITIYSQLVANRLVYNIETIQSYYLIRASSGLCVTRLRQCRIESSPRRKRFIDETTAYEVCNLFINEASKTVKKLLGNSAMSSIPHAREACVTDILSSSNAAWGESAVWLIVANSIRQASLSRSERTAMVAQIYSSVQEAVKRAKPQAALIV